MSTYQAQQDIVPSSGYAVAVLLNSFTTTFEHAYEISTGIIQLTEGNEPEIKAPIPKIIDLSLGFITLIYLVLGIRGIIRSEKWSDKRKQHPTWRLILRLTPHLVGVLFVGWFFFVVPNLQDVFIIGFIISGMRIYHRNK